MFRLSVVGSENNKNHAIGKFEICATRGKDGQANHIYAALSP